jgi:Fic family protein
MVYEDYGATRDKKMMVNQNKIFTSNLYQEIFNVSRNTASRHLNELVELEQVQKIGKGRYTKYKA